MKIWGNAQNKKKKKKKKALMQIHIFIVYNKHMMLKIWGKKQNLKKKKRKNINTNTNTDCI